MSHATSSARLLRASYFARTHRRTTPLRRARPLSARASVEEREFDAGMPPQPSPPGWTQRIVTLNPKSRGIYLWTNTLYETLPEIRDVKAGVVNLFLRSTTSAITVNENADPDVRVDLRAALEAIVPDDDRARASFVGVSMDLPIQGGRLALGTWQGLYLVASEPGPVELVATVAPCADVRATRNASVTAPRRGCHLAQDQIDAALAPTLAHAPEGVPTLVNVTVRHTSASLTINENADPSVRVDMENALNRIAPESWNRPGGAVTFNHVDEGDDDMPAHVKSTLFGASLTVPVASAGKKLALGTWQGVYLCEHRDAGGFGGGHARDVTATTMGREEDAAGQTTVTITAPGRGCHDVTSEIEKAVADVGSGVRTGVAHVFVKHTSASVAASERGAVDAGERLEAALNAVVPERWNDEFFTHTYEGPDDMPGHVKSSLMGVSLTLPVADGRLATDPSQGVFLCEHRDGGGFGRASARSVVVTVIGSSA